MSTTIARQCTLCEEQCGILVTADGNGVPQIRAIPKTVVDLRPS